MNEVFVHEYALMHGLSEEQVLHAWRNPYRLLDAVVKAARSISWPLDSISMAGPLR